MNEDEIILHTTWFGSFLVKKGEVIDKYLFKKDTDKLAEIRRAIENEKILEEEKKLIRDTESSLKVTSERLSEYGDLVDETELETKIEPEDYSFSYEMLQQTLRKLGGKKIEESIDFGEHLAKSVDTIQDLNETINIKMERIRDWYSLHFPELKDKFSEKDYVDLIYEHGERKSIMQKLDMEFESTGKEVTEDEVRLFKNLAGTIEKDMELREELEGYVKKKMERYAPNLAALTGPKLGGELIAAKGSLEELAKQPASTIQVLGAEKSLFRHLDKGTPPPKHGLILQHPYVHRAPKSLRGKIARTFANKIAIAARIDYFGDEFKGDELREELEKRIENIKKEN